MVIKLEEIPCNLCGCERYETLFKVKDFWLNGNETYRVVRCRRCGLIYLNPRPKPEELNKLYPPEFYNTDRDDAEILSGWNSLTNRGKASYISATPPGLCFEIGAYWGDFLYYMKNKGWSVQGCELSEYPRNVFGLDIFRGRLEDAGIPDCSVDLVTAWAVLEHVYDPFGLCKEVCRILKPGGQFVFTVPNFNSIGCRLLWKDDYPRHVYFFTKSSVRKLGTKSGFIADNFWFDDKIFKCGALGIIEFSIRKHLKLKFEDYLHEKRSYHELMRRSKLSAMQKAREAGLFWTGVRVVDHLLAPVLDRISMWTQTYGTMTVRLIKRS